jgi:hypothetical protein
MFGRMKFAAFGTAALLSLLLAGATLAQDGNGNGNGPGPGGNGQGPRYQHQSGGVEIVDPETGAGWRRGQGASRGMMGMYTVMPPAMDGELPQDVIDAMTAGLQDERNAQATYAAIIEQFGDIRPFVNILRAEEQHEQALLFMFERYNVAVPEAVAIDVPQFDNATAACAAAVQAEVDNAGLYDEMFATFADYPDLTQVATALRNASLYNHLPAFERCAG